MHLAQNRRGRPGRPRPTRPSGRWFVPPEASGLEEPTCSAQRLDPFEKIEQSQGDPIRVGGVACDPPLIGDCQHGQARLVREIVYDLVQRIRSTRPISHDEHDVGRLACQPNDSVC